MSIHDDGNGSSESCSSGSSQPTLQAVNGFSDDFESKFDVSLHQDTKGFILEPGRNARVRIRALFQKWFFVRNLCEVLNAFIEYSFAPVKSVIFRVSQMFSNEVSSTFAGLGNSGYGAYNILVGFSTGLFCGGLLST